MLVKYRIRQYWHDIIYSILKYLDTIAIFHFPLDKNQYGSKYIKGFNHEYAPVLWFYIFMYPPGKTVSTKAIPDKYFISVLQLSGCYQYSYLFGQKDLLSLRSKT